MTTSIEELEQHYYEITDLYDLAEELVNTVTDERVKNPNEQLAVVEPLIEEVEEAADILAEEFIVIAENQGRSKTMCCRNIEGALRKIYAAIDSYHARVGAALNDSASGIRNVADPIVKKIKRQMEIVVAALIDFVELSLERIMQKSHLEEMKQHQEKIALMIHQATQQH